MNREVAPSGRVNGQGEPIVLRDEWLPALYRTQPEVEDEIHVRDYLEVLWRRRWTVATFLAVVLFSTAVFTFMAVPMYRGTVLLEIRQDSPRVVGFKDVVELAEPNGYREFYKTQYDVLRSRALAKRVLEKVGAEQHRNSGGIQVLGSIRSFVGSLLPRRRPVAVAAEAREEQRQVDEFLSRVSVTPRRNSFLVEVSYESPDPHRAAAVANALGEEYISFSLDRRIEAAQKGREFIERQLDVSKANLERSEQALHEFADRNEIITLDERENVSYRKLADLNKALTKAQSQRMAKEALYRQARGQGAPLSLIEDNPLIKALKESLAEAEAEYARLGQTFTPEYPAMRRLAGKITDLHRRIASEERRIADSIEADYRAALEREKLLAAALAQQKRVVSDLNEKAIDYKILKREVETNRGIYENLLQRLKEVEVTEGIKASNIQVIDHAEVPLRPCSPRVAANLALALIVGLLGGVALAMFQEHLDNTLKTPEEVEKYLLLPMLGALPVVRARRSNGAPGEAAPELIALEDPSSAPAEALRTLRASLFLATADGPPQSILVTSARPLEGKTCVAANLALTLVQLGKRVVLVDADLRRPRLHRVFGKEIAPGLSNFLTGTADVPSIASETQVPHLRLVASGPIPPNPAELLNSARMTALLEELGRNYDFVVMDAPPTLGLADVALLSQVAGGVVLVVRSGETPRKTAKQAGDFLLRVKARVLGVVLNHVATDGRGYGYYYYYGYYNYGRRPGDPALAPPEEERAAAV